MIAPFRTEAREQGFTLIELMISMALFGLIAIAGLAMVDGLLGIQARTDGRLERLADVQRTLFVLTADLDQVGSGPIAGGGADLSFVRSAPALGGVMVSVRYAFTDGVVRREIAGSPQRLLAGVTGLRWRFYEPDLGWVERWPPDPARAADRPAAVAAELVLPPGFAGATGSLRRVVALPARP